MKIKTTKNKYFKGFFDIVDQHAVCPTKEEEIDFGNGLIAWAIPKSELRIYIKDYIKKEKEIDKCFTNALE